MNDCASTISEHSRNDERNGESGGINLTEEEAAEARKNSAKRWVADVLEYGRIHYMRSGEKCSKLSDPTFYMALGHETLESLCTNELHLSHARFYELIKAWTIGTSLESGMSDIPLPANARQACALAPLLKTPELMREVWRSLYATYGVQVTAKLITEEMNFRRWAKRTKFEGAREEGIAQMRAERAAKREAKHPLKAASVTVDRVFPPEMGNNIDHVIEDAVERLDPPTLLRTLNAICGTEAAQWQARLDDEELPQTRDALMTFQVWLQVMLESLPSTA